MQFVGFLPVDVVVELPELAVMPGTLLPVHDDRLVVTESVCTWSVVLRPGVTVATPVNSQVRAGFTLGAFFATVGPAPIIVAVLMSSAATTTSDPRRAFMDTPRFRACPPAADQASADMDAVARGPPGPAETPPAFG